MREYKGSWCSLRQFVPFRKRKSLEKTTERSFRDIAIEAGWFVEKIMKTSLSGFPDRFFARNRDEDRCIYCGRSRVVLMEFKRKGEDLSELQKKRIEELRAAGLEVYVVRSSKEARKILGI